MRNIPFKSEHAIFAEWDALAPIRLKQILSGQDLTYRHVLSPIMRDLADPSGGPVLDLGCGVGVMAEEFARTGVKVVGVDPSRKSITLARSVSQGEVAFECSSAEEFALQTKTRFKSIVANMVLMDALNLGTFVEAVARLLRRGGSFVFSITHPCFWPDYYGYAGAAWFDYSKELIVESPFRISNQQDCQLNSTHVHRPIQMYINTLVAAGLSIESFVEPYPPEDIMALYPRPWKYPRYLIIKCRLPKKI